MKTTLIIGGFVIVIALLLSWSYLFSPQSPTTLITDPNNLPGIATTAAPWSPEIANLRSRLKDIGLPALGAEGSALHIHQHMDLNINGTVVPIPASIGINEAGGFISPIHTHDTSGIIHVESNVVRNFTLGQFFDLWGVRFTATCLGGYCADGTHALRVYANGTLVSGDPRALVLAAHQEIMVVYGEASSTANILATYPFPSGY